MNASVQPGRISKNEAFGLPMWIGMDKVKNTFQPHLFNTSCKF